MNIAVFGGKFDPPPFGHILVIEQVLEIYKNNPKIDQIWIMPSNTHPWKKIVAPALDRLKMCKFLETEKIKVSDVEIKRGSKTFTIDTVKELQNRHKEFNFFWLCGSDTLNEFDKWKEYRKLQKMIQFLVFPRAGNKVKKNLPENFRLVENHNLLINNYSSSKIRNRIKKGLSIEGLVMEKVEGYIKDKRLYL